MRTDPLDEALPFHRSYLIGIGLARCDLWSCGAALQHVQFHITTDLLLDLSPFLRQIVKTQISLNGELSHGIVS